MQLAHDGQLLDANFHFRQLIGLPAQGELVVGEGPSQAVANIQSMTIPAELPALYSAMGQLLGGGVQKLSMAKRCRFPSGREQDVHVEMVVIKDAQGKPSAFMCSVLPVHGVTHGARLGGVGGAHGGDLCL